MHTWIKSSTFAVEMSKRIVYMAPVDAMSGSLSGRQELQYGEPTKKAYDVPTGEKVAASNYQPRVVAIYSSRKRVKYFQVRTRFSINMTSATRLNMASMGGAGAIYAAIVSDKTTQLYRECLNARPAGVTLRKWIISIIRPALAAKTADIVLANGLVLSNPWHPGTGVTVNISQSVYEKFSAVLGAANS